MDFTFSDEQQAIADLAGRILSEQLPPDRVRVVEQEPDWFARDVWAALARAELLGVCIAEDVGGSGYGILEACLLAEQLGRVVTPLPLVPTLVYGAMPVDRFGSAAQRAELLPGVVSGDIVLTAALHEVGSYTVPDVPATAATPVVGGGWRLDGEKQLVPAAHLSHRILVPARTGEATSAVFLVDPEARGVTLDRAVSTTGEPQFQLTLEGVTVDADAVLGGSEDGHEIVAWIVDHATAALCATAAGVCGRALELTATYVSEREQFGAKIGSFQAVSQRAADAWIDVEAIRLTAWQAAWRLSAGLPATGELAIAKFWAAEAGQRVVHTAQHLHGGVGVDVDYPVHRYFRWAKQLELTLGGATVSLLRLGAILAAEPV